jgi:hypothetical protein
MTTGYRASAVQSSTLFSTFSNISASKTAFAEATYELGIKLSREQ